MSSPTALSSSAHWRASASTLRRSSRWAGHPGRACEHEADAVTPQHSGAHHAELVGLWRLQVAIVEAGDDQEFEPVGRRREYLDAKTALDLALGVRPWEVSPLRAATAEPPSYVLNNPLQLEGWRKARELRGALEAAANEVTA